MQITGDMIRSMIIDGTLPALSLIERTALQHVLVNFLRIPRSKKSILFMMRRWKQTRETVALPRAPIAVRPFYVTEGQFSGEWKLPYTKHRKQLVFRFIADDWGEIFANTLNDIPVSLCVLDFRVSEFDGPMIEEFVRETGANEVVLSWSYANTIDNPDVQVAMAKDVEGALEYVKRGNPECFVWVTVCVGVSGTLEWVKLIKDLPFDGVALWGPYYVPVGDADTFLARPLLWARKIFGDKPVALAGFFGAKGVWAGNQESIARAPGEAKRIIPIARELGYAAIWLQTGYHPEHRYWRIK